MRRLISCFFATLLVILVAACGGEPPVKLNTGDAAPTFKTARPDGSAVDFPAAYAGQPVVLRFWADWCKFCEPEMKLIDAMRERHGGRFAILAVNAGQDKAAVEAFMKKLGVGYPAALDESSKIAKTYGVVGLPTTFLIDGQGIVRGKIIGESDEAMFERHLQALLK